MTIGASPETSAPLPNPNTKLPFWKTIGQAYAAFFLNFWSLIKLSWFWLPVVAAVTYFVTKANVTFMGDSIEAMLEAAKTGKSQRHSLPLELYLLSASQYLVQTTAGAIMAVGWHRLILRDEQPGLTSQFPSVRMWRYYGVGLLAMLIAALPFLAFWIPMMLSAGAFGVPVGSRVMSHSPLFLRTMLFVFVGWTLGLCALGIFMRIAAVLPARAIDRHDVTFGSSWHATRGNTLRLVFGLILCFVPPVLILQLHVLLGFKARMELPQTSVDVKERMLGFFEASVVPTTLMAVAIVLITMIAVGWLSLAYRHFFERAGALDIASARE